MNVYDFDGTIYDGESVLDFYFFSIKKDARLLRYAWVVILTYLRYKACRISAEELLEIAQKYASEYVRRIPDMKVWVKEFWDKNERKIKAWYKDVQKEDDVVISASFDILLEEICHRLGIRHFLSSSIDRDSGEVTALCFHQNKRKMWEEKFPGEKILAFYTDSKMDSPLMEIAERGYRVSGETVKQVK